MGRIRRLSQAARAQYLATDEARRDVMITLVSEVASIYFQLLDLDQELAIQRSATNAYAGSHRIFNDRLNNGVASKLELNIATAENQLNGLVAGFVVARRTRITTMQHLPFAMRAGIEAPGTLEEKGGKKP